LAETKANRDALKAEVEDINAQIEADNKLQGFATAAAAAKTAAENFENGDFATA